MPKKNPPGPLPTTYDTSQLTEAFKEAGNAFACVMAPSTLIGAAMGGTLAEQEKLIRMVDSERLQRIIEASSHLAVRLQHELDRRAAKPEAAG